MLRFLNKLFGRSAATERDQDEERQSRDAMYAASFANPDKERQIKLRAETPLDSPHEETAKKAADLARWIAIDQVPYLSRDDAAALDEASPTADKGMMNGPSHFER